MDIQFYGGNCIVINTKAVRVVVDDNLIDLGAKSVAKASDLAIFTSAHAPVEGARAVLDRPGEYEVASISTYGIPVRAHMDEPGQKTGVMFKLIVGDTNIAVLGHMYPDISEADLERLGMVDILFVPVGGNGYTLDPIGALKLIKKIEPKLAIPTHYEDKTLKYPVPQQPLAEALKVIAMEPLETTQRLKIKAAEYADTTHLIVLERS